jgi:hypothetical protein
MKETMSDPSQRRPWTEGPDEDAPPESWLGLNDDELLHRIETLGAEEDEDDRLLEVVTGDRHFFIRQEAAKRVKDRRRLFVFEDDRHVGQILVRHLLRREDLTYLERISMLSRHVEVRQAAQVQLARVWRRLEKSQARDTRPMLRPSLPAPAPPPASPTVALPTTPASRATPVVAEAPSTSAPLEGDQVDGSLLGWAAHFLVEQVWNHLGTVATRELLLRTHGELAPSHATLSLFAVGQDARVTLDLESGPRIPRAAVTDVARWMAGFRGAARRVAPDADGQSVRASTALMADALRAAGFYSAFDEAEAALRP